MPSANKAHCDQVIELTVGAGYEMFELVDHEAKALCDAWTSTTGPVRVTPGRVGIESAARIHNPEIVLSSYVGEPPPATERLDGEGGDRVPLRRLGTWTVVFAFGHVEVWS